ncbi:D-alanyl-D-alanine carboxypeptidase family protein [Paucilactobacillus wasatchensis]|uniref:serine-type D-Ala-D-Ala carboxypeptidase n=1 Tax=Paucilactobacillus wasatchensis TaxID=1335616 RepID=A0A0D0Y7U4_9LACO|nr:serine hydrolase [Paucilactobacillus wasatchensis]KIS04333.1 D-alanyl-D-alanine carboxypeptidase [Paucilactobacillus wasatchensis]
MKLIKKWVVSVLAALLVFNVGGMAITAHAATKIDASAALVMDANTGQIIYEKNADKVLPVASITKLLTIEVIKNEIDHNKLNWNSKVKISKKLAKISTNTELSNVELKAGSSYTVKQLVHASLISSADAATLALTTINGNTTASFNTKMEKMARKMGVTDAKIYNAVGLKNSDLGALKLKNVAANSENEMSASDIAKIAQYIVKNDPDILKITKIKKETFHTTSTASTVMDSLNQMLPGSSFAPKTVTMDGLKTGTSDAAGNSFVGTGNYKGGHRLITVVLHANGATEQRFVQTFNLLRLVVNNYKPVTLKANSTLKTKTVAVPNGKQTKLAVRVAKDTTVWVAKGSQLSAWKQATTIKKSLQDKKHKLAAPVKAGQTVGTVQLTKNGVTTLTGKSVNVPVKAHTAMNKANIFVRMYRAIF